MSRKREQDSVPEGGVSESPCGGRAAVEPRGHVGEGTAPVAGSECRGGGNRMSFRVLVSGYAIPLLNGLLTREAIR